MTLPPATLRMGQTLHPTISPKRQEEPLPDHPGQLVLGDGDEPECLVEADELQGVEEHVQLFMAAGVDQYLHDESCEATTAELFEGKNAIDFVPVLVQSAPRNGAASVPSTKVPNMRSSAGGLGSCWW